MTIEQKRAYLMSLYGEAWKKRVKNMGDDQILAVYAKTIQSKKEHQ